MLRHLQIPLARLGSAVIPLPPKPNAIAGSPQMVTQATICGNADGPFFQHILTVQKHCDAYECIPKKVPPAGGGGFSEKRGTPDDDENTESMIIQP